MMMTTKLGSVLFWLTLTFLAAIGSSHNVAQAAPSLFPVGEIETIADLVLEMRGDKADVYYPAVADSVDGFPVVAVLQGAGVDKGFYSEFATQLARFGFVVVIPNHFQVIPPVPAPILFPDQEVILDVLDQMELENNDPSSDLFGIVDTTRMGLGGHSAGGAAGLFAIDESCFPPFCIPAPPFFALPDAVRVGAFYGTNTCAAGGEAKDPDCINFDTIPPNPSGKIFAIDNNNIPVALVQGSVDGIGTPPEAQASIDVLAALRKLITIEGANHYGITDVNNPPGAIPDQPGVDIDPRPQDVAQAMGQFLSTYLEGELIPADFPVFTNKLDVGDDVAVNGRRVAKGKTGADSVVDIDANRDFVGQFLPDLVPSVFPANTSKNKVKVTDQDPPFVSDTAVFFKDVEIQKEESASFSGGGPFHIDKLKVKKGAILNLAAGIYFVNTLEMKDDDAQINITSEPVTLHIGKQAKVQAKRLILNAEGSVAGFLVYLHEDAELKAKELELTGVVYGPASKKVELEKATLRGVFITSGEVKLKKALDMTYTKEDQASVGATIITP